MLLRSTAAATVRHWPRDRRHRRTEARRQPRCAAHPSAPGRQELERAFNDTALAARDSDPPSFLTTLDPAAQAAALQPGVRMVVAILNSRPSSSDGKRELDRLMEVCQAGAIRVLVLDIAEGGLYRNVSDIRLTACAGSPALPTICRVDPVDNPCIR